MPAAALFSHVDSCMHGLLYEPTADGRHKLRTKYNHSDVSRHFVTGSPCHTAAALSARPLALLTVSVLVLTCLVRRRRAKQARRVEASLQDAWQEKESSALIAVASGDNPKVTAA